MRALKQQARFHWIDAALAACNLPVEAGLPATTALRPTLRLPSGA